MRLSYYVEQGFDRSTRSGKYIRPQCSQCEALVIQGCACHEQGCPNQVFECKGCTANVAHAGTYCEDCQ